MGGRNGAAKDITGSHENNQCFGGGTCVLACKGWVGYDPPFIIRLY